MSGSIFQIVQRWHEAQQSGSQETLWVFLVKTNPWIFAHHPANACFREHVWTICGLHFCKGCVVTVLGWLLGVVLQLGTGWLNTLSIPSIAALFTAMLIPSVVTALLGAPRAVKHVARLLLGVLMASAIWLLIIAEDWWVRIILVAVYFLVKVPLDRKRRMENQRRLRLESVKSGTGRNTHVRHSH